MRQIKFRAWDNVDYMSTPFTLYDIQSRRIEFTEDAVIMQFTGLLDKTGKEIYESDIVKIFAGTNDENLEEVLFDGGCFVVDGYVPLYVHCQDDNHNVDEEVPHCEIIGNIYENPDLLKDSVHSENPSL